MSLSAPARRHRRLERPDRHDRRGGTVECPAEPTERDRARPERRAGVGHDGLEVELSVVPLLGEQPEEQRVRRQHDHERAAERPLAEPGGVVLQLVEAEPVAGEPLEQPRRQPEQPDLLGGGRLGREVVGVVGVAAGGLDLVGVAVAPDAALAEQPVGRAPGGQQQERRPPGEPEQHEGGGDAAEEHHEPLGDEVHVHEHRRPGLSEVEVAGRGEVVGQVAALEVADAVGPERGRHQPVVEDAAEAVAEQGADDLVDRRGDLRDHEDDAEHDQRHGQVGARLERARRGGRWRSPARRAPGSGRRSSSHHADGEPGHRAGQGDEEPGGGGTEVGEHPRQRSGHAVTLEPAADTRPARRSGVDYPYQGGQSGGEVGAFGVVVAEVDGAGELGARLLGTADPGQQLAADAGQPVPGSSSAVEGAQPGVRAVRLGHGDGPVEPDDGRVARAPRSSSYRATMRGQSVASGCGAIACSAAISACRRYGVPGAAAWGVSSVERLGDLVGVPAGPVLVGQQHQPAVAHPRVAPRVLEQHQREQAVEVGAPGQQVAEQPGQPDRLGRPASVRTHVRARAAARSRP